MSDCDISTVYLHCATHDCGVDDEAQTECEVARLLAENARLRALLERRTGYAPPNLPTSRPETFPGGPAGPRLR